MTDDDPFPMKWTVHPAREQPARSVMTMLVIAAIAGMSAVIMEHWLFGLLAVIVMGVMLKSFFLPGIYELDENGISLKNPWEKHHLRWADIRRFRHQGRRGYLSTRSQASMMDTFSGMHLLFDDQAEHVIQVIQQQLAKH